MFNKRRNDIERLDCDIHSMAKEINENRETIKRLAKLCDNLTTHIGNLVAPIIKDVKALRADNSDIHDKIRYTVSAHQSMQAAYQSTSTMRKDFDGMITELDRLKTTVKKLNKDLGNA